MEEAVRAVLALVDSVTPAQACQAYYTFGAAAILAVKVLPQDIQSTLLSYGPRDQGQGNGLLSRVLKGTEVPHAWFLHFYVLSVASSALWAWQLVTCGTAMEWLARRQSAGEEDGSMTMAQVYLAWGLMAVQGVRRLYESLAVTKAGSSPMSAIHYLIGSSYYVVMGVSVWIQGSGMP